jgi:hypothetical protein
LQLDLLETCADLIFNSGKPDDLNSFLYILARHQWHRAHPESDFSQRIERDVQYWTRELGRSVPEKEIGVSDLDERPEVPTSMAEYVRANLRHTVARSLDTFVRNANPLELYFMKEVLERREGSHCGGIPEEVPIAQFCSVELDRCEKIYFAVPEELEKAFNQFRCMIEREKAKQEAA